MTEFVFDNIENIVLAIAALATLFRAIYTGQWAKVKAAAYSFMFLAADIMSTEEGKKKMDWVFAEVWQQLPRWLKSFITEESLREKLQHWYNLAKSQFPKE